MQFLNPALLAGALLFAVPLLIHLLNRQRHKRRPWAAMEFLLRAYQKQRNRVRTENLLLLLLRCLLPIALALAVARPLWQQAQGLLGAAGTVHHLLVIDGSYSMAVAQGGAPSPFERARALAGRLLDRFDDNPNRTDKVSLVLAGVRPRFLVRGDLDLATARSQWLLLQKPEDAASDLGEALRQTADALEQSGDAEAAVYVFTDLQARSLGQAAPAAPEAAPTTPAAPAAAPAAPELTDTLRDTVERLQKRPGTELHWIDCSPLAEQRQGGTADNAQVTSLTIAQPAAVVRTPVEVLVGLKNRGTASLDAEVTLEIDGGEPLRKVVTLPAGAEGEAEFQVAFREPGRRRLRASLAGDGLTVDDERFAVVEVRERIRVLVVDGAADDDPLRGYGYLWQAVLDPDPQALPTFAVHVVDALALLGGQVDPADFEVTVLADLDRLNARAAAALDRALRAGRGLLVACGERTDAESYNLHLHAAGDGPMPFRLGRTAGSAPGTGVVRSPSIALPDHPLFREFEEPVYREILQAIPVWRWLAVAEGSLAADAQVAARLTDADQSPLLVAKPFGEGKAVFLTSTIASRYRADRWNRLDEPMVAFPLLHGLVKWLALPANDPFQVLVGAELTCSLPARPVDLELQRPERDGGGKAPLDADSRPLPGGRFALPPVADVRHAGFYVVEGQLDREAGREPLSLPFAVNVDPDEGELRYLAHAEAQQALGLPRVLTNLPQPTAAAASSGQNELGPTFLLLTLLLVLGEAAWARHVSVRRS